MLSSENMYKKIITSIRSINLTIIYKIQSRDIEPILLHLLEGHCGLRMRVLIGMNISSEGFVFLLQNWLLLALYVLLQRTLRQQQHLINRRYLYHHLGVAVFQAELYRVRFRHLVHFLLRFFERPHDSLLIGARVRVDRPHRLNVNLILFLFVPTH